MKLIFFVLIIIASCFLIYSHFVVPNKPLITRSIDNFSDPNKDHIYTDLDIQSMHQDPGLCYSNSDCQQSCFNNALCQDNGVTYNCSSPGNYNKFNSPQVMIEMFCPQQSGYGVCMNNRCTVKKL